MIIPSLSTFPIKSSPMTLICSSIKAALMYRIVRSFSLVQQSTVLGIIVAWEIRPIDNQDQGTVLVLEAHLSPRREATHPWRVVFPRSQSCFIGHFSSSSRYPSGIILLWSLHVFNVKMQCFRKAGILKWIMRKLPALSFPSFTPALLNYHCNIQFQSGTEQLQKPLRTISVHLRAGT